MKTEQYLNSYRRVVKSPPTLDECMNAFARMFIQENKVFTANAFSNYIGVNPAQFNRVASDTPEHQWSSKMVNGMANAFGITPAGLAMYGERIIDKALEYPAPSDLTGTEPASEKRLLQITRRAFARLNPAFSAAASVYFVSSNRALKHLYINYTSGITPDAKAFLIIRGFFYRPLIEANNGLSGLL